MGNSPGAGNEPSRVLFRHATVLDTASGELAPDQTVLVEGDRIREVGGTDAGPREARVADLRGMTLMPGLIDAHVHVTAVTADLSALAEWSPYYVAARAGDVLRGMLGRRYNRQSRSFAQQRSSRRGCCGSRVWWAPFGRARTRTSWS